MKKKLKSSSLCVALAMLVFLLVGCNGQPSAAAVTEAPSPSPSPSPSVTAAAAPQPTPAPDPEPVPIDFTWQAHVYSDIYKTAFSKETEQCFSAMVDAIMAGEDSFACPDSDADSDMFYNLNVIASVCFPPYAALVSDISLSDGVAYLTYAVDDGQRQQILNDFERQITALIRSAVMKDDSPAMKAIALYHAYAGMITYDDDAAENEDALADVSSYRALTELSGICQSFAPAYAYLCLQCGVDAVNVSGMNESDMSHEWTLLSLDGKYYYADPTYENGDGGMGLRYFGMTAAQRESEDGYIADEYNIGNTNVIWGCDIDVTDERFAPLWEAAYVSDIRRTDGVMRILCERADGTQFEFAIDPAE